MTDDERRDLGQRMRDARIAAGFASQQALATRIGVDRNSIGRIELGHMSPSVETIRAWADACGVSVDALLGRSGVPRRHDESLPRHPSAGEGR